MMNGPKQGPDHDLVKVWQKMHVKRFDNIMLKTQILVHALCLKASRSRSRYGQIARRQRKHCVGLRRPRVHIGGLHRPQVAWVGTHAGDMIGEIALAIEMGADAVDNGKTIHLQPKLGESIGMAAALAYRSCKDFPPTKK